MDHSRGVIIVHPLWAIWMGASEQSRSRRTEDNRDRLTRCIVLLVGEFCSFGGKKKMEILEERLEKVWVFFFSQDTSVLWLQREGGGGWWREGGGLKKADCFCLRVRVGIGQNGAGREARPLQSL